jgi:hypothetical protein
MERNTETQAPDWFEVVFPDEEFDSEIDTILPLGIV